MQLTRHLREDTAGVLHADGLTDEMDDDGRLDRLVEPHLPEIDVRDGAANRIALEMGQHRRMHGLLALDDHVEDRVEPRRAGNGRSKIPLGDEDRARVALPVEDAGHEPGRAQAPRVARPALLALLHLELEPFA